jgi:hypothetical protein
VTDDEFQQSIITKKNALDAILAEMDQIRTQFIMTAVKFVKIWWLDQAKTQVALSSKVTEALTDDQVRQLKADVQALASDAEKHILEFFSDGGVWWHMQAELKASNGSTHAYYGSSQNPPKLIEGPLRFVLGKLAPVMEKYGYLTSSQSRHGSTFEWREWDRGGQRQLPNGRPYYPTALVWTQELATIIERYSIQHKRAEGLLRDVSTIEIERKQALAAKRWDSA